MLRSRPDRTANNTVGRARAKKSGCEGFGRTGEKRACFGLKETEGKVGHSGTGDMLRKRRGFWGILDQSPAEIGLQTRMLKR